MKECDVAVAPCGTTLYELASMCILTIGLVEVEYQILASETMDTKGIIKYSSLQKLYEDIAHLSYEKRKHMSFSGSSIMVEAIERRV